MIQCGHFTVILVYFLGHPVIEKIDTLIIAMVFPSSSKPCWDKATNPASMIIWLRCPPKWPIIRVKTRAAISSRWHEPNCNHINLYHLTNISKSVWATNKLQHCNCLMSDLGTGFYLKLHLTFVPNFKRFMVHKTMSHRHTVFENHSKCRIWDFQFLAFLTNFCPIKIDLSGNTVWHGSFEF